MAQNMLLGRKAHNKDCTVTTDLYTEITLDNLNEVFAFNYSNEDNVLGAKAVAYETVNKDIEVCFFAQGNGRIGNNVHHRDVFATIIELFVETPQFKSYEKVLEVIAELYPLNGAELEKAAERVFEPSQGNPELARKFVDEVVKCGAWNKAFIPLLELKEKTQKLSALVKQRSNHDLEKDPMFDWIFSAQGYQFSARASGGRMVIESAEMDSSLTSLQRKYPQNARPGLYERMNAEILQRIPPSLRRFRTIAIPRDLLGADESQ